MMPMHDLLAPYLLGSLGEEEHEAFSAHLLDCQDCQAEMTELEPGLAHLASANAVTPSSGLRDAVLESVQGSPTEDAPKVIPVGARRGWNVLILPAAAILIIVIGLFAIFSSNPIDDIVGAPDATVVALAPSDSLPGQPPSTAQVVFSPSQQGAVIEINGLAPASGSNVYEMWLINADGATPAGTFSPNSDGSVQVRLEGSPEPGLVVGITEEPAGGSTTPTGDVLFVSDEL